MRLFLLAAVVLPQAWMLKIMSSPVATIYIPYASYHSLVVHRAIQSASAQTVQCEVVSGPSLNTPAAFRNTAMNATTPFVVWLDADDAIAPDFVEKCLHVYEQGRYIYTSWIEGGMIMHPRDCNPYLAHDFNDGRGKVGGYHLVTTLFPTALFQALNGFDETLPGMEDTDFYMRAQANGVCGILCKEPLLIYTEHAETRSKQFRARPDYEALRRSIIERHGGIEAMAGCCGIVGGGQQANLVGEQPGDVAVMTLYAPATQYGRATGRFYPRTQFMGQTIMVDPQDAAAMPELFRTLESFKEIAPKREIALQEAGLI